MNIAFVLWEGVLGGAERFATTLAAEFKRNGVSSGVVFLGSDRPLSRLLDAQSIPYHALNLRRGSEVVLRPKKFAELVATFGADGVILDSLGYVGMALRAGGYRQRVVSVEHGALIERGLPARKRLARSLYRRSGAWATDIEIAVSDYLLEVLLHNTHARKVLRIHNGVDLGELVSRDAPTRDVLSLGWAGRMVWGKGVPELLQAVAILARDTPVELHLAGDGPDRTGLVELVQELDLQDRVFFAGSVLDMGGFWADRDLAVFPTNGLVESFGLAAVEAMASAIPVVASRSGGLAEVVDDGRTGRLVAPGDVQGLAAALRAYAVDRDLRLAHGSAARAACEERFDIRACAKRYLSLFDG